MTNEACARRLAERSRSRDSMGGTEVFGRQGPTRARLRSRRDSNSNRTFEGSIAEVGSPDEETGDLGWDRWEPFGTNRGGKGASRGGRAPRSLGPEGPSSWRHDLFEEAFPEGFVTGSRPLRSDGRGRLASSDPWRPPWLPPRGVGSGRNSSTRGGDEGLFIEVSNLDRSASTDRLKKLFGGAASGLRDAWVDAGCGWGGAEFCRPADAKRIAQRFHRHPWLGGRPMNVRVVAG